MTIGIFGKHKHNFIADITILPLGPNTRKKHPFNGIRWDFCYAEDLDDEGLATEVSMIWPEFVNMQGIPIATDVPLKGTLTAYMHIVSVEMVDLHRQRLKEGSRFYCTEGSRVVAEGLVVSLDALRENKIN